MKCIEIGRENLCQGLIISLFIDFTGTVLLDLEKFDLPSIAEAVVENMMITDQISQTDSNKVLAALLLRHRHQYQMSPPIARRPSSYNLLALARKDSKPSMPVEDPENKLPEPEEGETLDEGAIRLKIDESDSDFPVQEISQVSHTSFSMPEGFILEIG